MAIGGWVLDTLPTLCYIVGMSRITKTLAIRARQLADDVWAEGKSFEYGDRDAARELKDVSTQIHNQASRLEAFEQETIRKVHNS